VNLGNESGLDFLKALKRHGLFKRIPVVMSTAVKEREQVVELIQAGIAGFEVKPLRAEKIEGHLNKYAYGEPLPGAFLHFTLVSEGKNMDQFHYGELIEELKEKWHFALEEWQSAIIEGEVRQAPRSVHALRGDAYYIGFEYGVDMLDTLIDCLNSGKSEEALLILKELGGVPQLLQAFLVRHKLNRSPAERDRGTPETGQPAEQESDSPDGEEPAEAAASGFPAGVNGRTRLRGAARGRRARPPVPGPGRVGAPQIPAWRGRRGRWGPFPEARSWRAWRDPGIGV